MSNKYLQVRLTDDLDTMKHYLIKNGINVSEYIRKYLVSLYGFQKTLLENSE